jgi:hypothetical protein
MSDDIRREIFRRVIADITHDTRDRIVQEAAERGQFILCVEVTIVVVPIHGETISCTSSTPAMSTTPIAKDCGS